MVHGLLNDSETCRELKSVREKGVKVLSMHMAGRTE